MKLHRLINIVVGQGVNSREQFRRIFKKPLYNKRLFFCSLLLFYYARVFQITRDAKLHVVIGCAVVSKLYCLVLIVCAISNVFLQLTVYNNSRNEHVMFL